MLVSLSGQRFTFPHQCACCNAKPDTTLNAAHSKTTGRRIIKTKTWSWEFPYCSSCVEHVRAWSNAVALSCGAGIVAFLLVLMIAGGTNNETGVMIAILVGVIAWITGLFVLRKKARAKCSQTCTSPDAAVSYVNWYGTVHSFDVRSRTYAALFMLSNAKKLINLTEEGRQLMEWALTNVAPSHVEIENDDDQVTITVSPRDRNALPSGSSNNGEDEQLVRALSKLESLKGASSRRVALDAALKTLRTDEAKQRLLVEASKIEVSAVLDKVDVLKTKSAKKRALLAALDEIRNDGVSDAAQAKQIEMLESALREIDAE